MKKIILVAYLLLTLHHLQFASVASSVRKTMPALSTMAVSSLTSTAPAATTSLNFNPTYLPQPKNTSIPSTISKYTSSSITQRAGFTTQQNKTPFMNQLKNMTFSVPTQQIRNISSGVFTPDYQSKKLTEEGSIIHESAHTAALVFVYTGNLYSEGVEFDNASLNYDKNPTLQTTFKNNFPQSDSLKGRIIVYMAGVVAQQMFDPNYKFYHPTPFTNPEDILHMIIEYNEGYYEHYGAGIGDFKNIYNDIKNKYEYDNAKTINDIEKYKKPFDDLYDQLSIIFNKKWDALPANATQEQKEAILKQDTPEEIKILNQLNTLKTQRNQRIHQKFVQYILELYPITCRFVQEYEPEIRKIAQALTIKRSLTSQEVYDILQMHHPLNSEQGEHPGAQQFLERAFRPDRPKITDPARLLSAQSKEKIIIEQPAKKVTLTPFFNPKNMQANINQLSPEQQNALYQQHLKNIDLHVQSTYKNESSIKEID